MLCALSCSMLSPLTCFVAASHSNKFVHAASLFSCNLGCTDCLMSLQASSVEMERLAWTQQQIRRAGQTPLRAVSALLKKLTKGAIVTCMVSKHCIVCCSIQYFSRRGLCCSAHNVNLRLQHSTMSFKACQAFTCPEYCNIIE